MQLPHPTAATATVLLGGLLLSSCSQPAAPAQTAPGTTAAAAQPQPHKSSEPGAAHPIFRLPGDVRPTKQRIEIEIVPERPGFSGRVEISLQVERPRSDLFLSARGLTLTRGTLKSGGQTMPVTFEADDARGAARVMLPRRIEAGPATLVVEYKASFNPHLVGLYRVKARDRWYAYTQFEAIDARRAFPCFDEPSFKIPWEAVLTVPKDAVAVFNTPVVEETPAGALKRVRFQPTRPLSSYFLALAVGEFDVVTPPPLPPNEIRARPLQVRGIAPKGRGPELAYALEAGAELLVMLERWFGTEFPYPKLDHIAVPDFEYGAMENAGAITYREPLLLVDPKTASEAQKVNVAAVVAHEVAHQWYGDLVTMAWWDDLWLNESFASFMEGETVPEWGPEFGYELGKLQEVHGAMQNDELSTVRPIRPDLKVEGDIFGFDYQVAYHKGSRVVSMFEGFLGSEAFRAGLKQYLAKHADGNATRDDLITALSAQGKDIRPAMRSFVDQPGIPLVQANLRCDGGKPRVALKQSRNLPLGSTASREVRWAVPVCVRSSASRRADCMLLERAEAELALESKSCPDWIALNPEGQGYYRWSLPPEQLRDLLKKGYRHLSAAERLSLGNNLAAGLRSGALSASDVLEALRPLARDPEPAVAQEPGDLLLFVHEYVVEPSQQAAVREYMRSLYRPVLARLGWKAKAKEAARVHAFRQWVIEYMALAADDKKVLERAAALGRAYLGSDGKLHPEAVAPDLVSVAVKAAARTGSAALFDTILERLSSAEDSTVREHLLAGLAAFTDPQLSERARQLTFDERLRINERMNILAGQAGAGPALRAGAGVGQRPQRAAWEWVVRNFETLAPRLPPAYVRFLTLMQGGCSEEEATELKQKLGPAMARYPGGPYSLAKAVEKTRLCAAQVSAQRKSATEFFAKQ
jgi:alanyl aminopeptidase